MRPPSWAGKVTSLFSAIFAGMCLAAAVSYGGDKADISQPLAGLSGSREAGPEEFPRHFRTRDGLGPQFDENSCHSCQDKAGISQSLAGLSGLQLSMYEAGLEEFERRFRTQDGLGPQFNENSCHSCHRQPSVGGAGPRYRSNFNFADGSDLLELEGGPLLQVRAIRREPRELIPAAATNFSLRKVPPLYGLGLAEAIPDSQIAAVAARNGGKSVFTEDGGIQRFGSQNQVASLKRFVTNGFALELGITEGENPEIAQSIQNVVSFIRFLAPPPRGEINEDVLLGEQVFAEIGCADCHTPAFTTAPGPFTTASGEVVDVAALQNKTIMPYSDFLLHDLGLGLDDGVPLHGGSSAEYRTIPLWGLRFRKNKLMHDARAANFRQMLLFHGGEAAAARDEAMSLPREDRRALEKFLDSL